MGNATTTVFRVISAGVLIIFGVAMIASFLSGGIVLHNIVGAWDYLTVRLIKILVSAILMLLVTFGAFGKYDAEKISSQSVNHTLIVMMLYAILIVQTEPALFAAKP
jgi:hypothetical protein